VRYQAALRPDITCRIDSKVLSNVVTTPNHDFRPRPYQIRAHCTVTVPERAPAFSAEAPAFSAGISFAWRFELLQSFALHLQFHLRILLEDSLVSLTKHLCYPLVGHTTGTEPRGIGRAEVVNAKIRNLARRSDSGQFVLGQPENQKNKARDSRLPTAPELFPELINARLDKKDRLPPCSALEALER
jgi:hypothetical protein